MLLHRLCLTETLWMLNFICHFIIHYIRWGVVQLLADSISFDYQKKKKAHIQITRIIDCHNIQSFLPHWVSAVRAYSPEDPAASTSQQKLLDPFVPLIYFLFILNYLTIHLMLSNFSQVLRFFLVLPHLWNINGYPKKASREQQNQDTSLLSDYYCTK